MTSKLSHAVTLSDVTDIHLAHLARYTAVEALQATRTEVHALLQLQCPLPYSGKPESLLSKEGRLHTNEDIAEIFAHRQTLVTSEDVQASNAARAKGSTHGDALHFVQREHGRALWIETDAMVQKALFKKVAP